MEEQKPLVSNITNSDNVDDEFSFGQKKYKNIITIVAVASSFMLNYTAFAGIQNLMTSLNPDIGAFSLACVTGGELVTGLLSPAILGTIGPKYGLVLAWLGMIVFVGCNFYPSKYVLLPASVFLGLGTGLMWTSQGVYYTTTAMNLSKMSGETFDYTLSRIFGFAIMALQSGQIWGNLLSSAVLQTENNNDNSTDSNSRMMFCGVDNCPVSQNATEMRTPTKAEYILLGIYMGCILIGLFITLVLLKPLQSNNAETLKSRLSSTVRLLLTESNMALLVPFSLYTGMEGTIIFAEFTKSFVTCELGIEWVGYTMLCFGISNTCSSPVIGIIAKYTGRPVLYFFGTLLNVGALAIMLFWIPDKHEKILFFVIPALWGLGDAIWQTLSSTLVGVIFRERQEPAFANLRLFMSLGFFICYMYSNELCEDVKLYIIFGALICSMALVSIVEIRLRRGLMKNKQ